MENSINKCLLNKSDFNINTIEITIEERTNSIIKNIIINSEERIAYIYFFIGSILIGISSFGIKFTSMMFPEEFTSNGFLTWRSLSVLILSIILIKRNNEKLIRFSEVKHKNWFILRTAGNYFGFFFLILCMMELRATTASCISSMSPIIVLIFSIFILKDTFYLRYLIGLMICLLGNLIIILNERKPDIVNNNFDKTHDNSEINDILRIIRGTLFGILHILCLGFVITGSKILAVENITNNEQCFYIGLTNTILALISCIVYDGISFNLAYVLITFIFGLAYYSANVFFVQTLKIINLSKLTPLSYINTLTIFFLAVLICGEKIYITDILGSIGILLFNIYNVVYPVK